MTTNCKFCQREFETDRATKLYCDCHCQQQAAQFRRKNPFKSLEERRAEVLADLDKLRELGEDVPSFSTSCAQTERKP